MEEVQERKNKRIGTAVSIGIHALLLILFAFILAWREPDPPLPEYGIEINFGLADQGSGDVQPQTPVSEEVTEEEPAPEEPAEEEVTDTEASEPEEIEEVVEEVVEETPVPVTNTQESPEVVPDQPVEKPQEKQPEEQPEEKTEKKPEPKPVTEPTESGDKGEGKAPAESSSQGDDKDKEGDKGVEEGKIDARALYGKPGGGEGGTSLKIVGWMWDEEPRKKDSSNENGTVTFEFLIDEEGYVIRVVTLERSISPSVAKFYEQQLQQTTFSRTGDGTGAPGNTKGTVTFTIVSK